MLYKWFFLIILGLAVSCTGYQMISPKIAVRDVFSEPESQNFVTAVVEGKLEIVKKMVAENLDVNLQGKYQMTPLYVAVYYQKKEIAAYLLEQGANPWISLKDLPPGYYLRNLLPGSSAIEAIVNDPNPDYLLVALESLEPGKECEMFKLFVESAPGIHRNRCLTGEEVRRVDLIKLDAILKKFPCLHKTPRADVYLEKALKGNRFPCVLVMLQKGFPVSFEFFYSIIDDRNKYKNTDKWPKEAQKGLVKPYELCDYLESIDPDIFTKCETIIEERDHFCDPATPLAKKQEARLRCNDSLRLLAKEFNAKRGIDPTQVVE